MNEEQRKEALRKATMALGVIQSAADSQLLPDARRSQIAQETADNFAEYVNPAVLAIRKSCVAGGSEHPTCDWKGRGDTVIDIHGNEYIDCIGGMGVYLLGHRHPEVVAAVKGQLECAPIHSEELLDPLRGYLSEVLSLVTPGSLKYSFLCCTGTEATEGALKLAKLYASKTKPGHARGVIAALGGYHGKTLGALSVTARRSYREPYYPMVPGAHFVPFGDADALEHQLRACAAVGSDVAAFIVEPIQGLAGAVVPPADYFPRVRKICDKWGVLLIVDEVQVGMGRTGKLWAIEHWDCEPDILCVGKAFGGGVVPAGAFVARSEVFEPMFDDYWLHTSTFGGYPLSCAASLAAIHVTLRDDIPHQAAVKGERLKRGIAEAAASFPDVVEEVRGVGLIIGVETRSADISFAIGLELFRRGVLVTGSKGMATSYRYVPPAVITEAHIDRVVEATRESLAEVAAMLRAGSLSVSVPALGARGD